MKKLKLIYASCVSAIISIIFATVITIWAEFAPSLKDFLKSLTGHHWVTKSWGVVILYVACLALFFLWPKQIKEHTVRRSIETVIVFALVGSAALFFFFLWHYLGE